MKPKRFYFSSTSLFGVPLRCGGPVFMGFTVLISGLRADGGDLLRGGGSPGKPGAPAAGGAAAAPTPAASDAARVTAIDSLARTTQALASARAMQAAARDAAIRGANNTGAGPLKPAVSLPDVPNGLVTGGLQVAAGVATDPTRWVGADLPSQAISKGLTNVTIRQTAQQALLNWQTFNVGKETTVTFDQTAGGANAGQWIAFNKISDTSGSPTQILGSIKAAGQVYLINTNGIIFGGSSQVNVHTLVASSLPINDNLVARGLLNNPDQQFLFSALGQISGANGTPAFNPGLAADTRIGDVTVLAGAQLTAPTTDAKVGGRIALIGANVNNAGTIETPDGQTILAAGLQVGFDAHNTADPSLRGLDTFVGAVIDPASTLAAYAGSATNSGIIDAPRASVTVAGKNVSQFGVIHSTTSVSLNGRIDLLAGYNAIGNIAFNASNATFGPAFLNRSTGSVLLGEGSVTRILPELDSTEKAIGSVLALRSQVNISSHDTHFAAGSILLAPNAAVAVDAGVWYLEASTSATNPPIHHFVREGGRIDLDPGSVIDVSGSKNVIASAASNIVEVQLRAAELADSPLQRDGALRGETIFVDITKSGTYNGKIWIGTPLADVSGYANLVQRSAGELTVAGGTVSLNAGNAVVVRDGATIDVSGGSVNYQGAAVQTSRVVIGKTIIDIANATPDLVYDGLYDAGFKVDHPKWGISQSFQQPLAPSGKTYQGGFTQGGNGGILTISAAAMALDGRLTGTTVTGPRQRDVAPIASKLTLSFTAERILSGQPSSFSPTPPRVTFSNSPLQAGVPAYSADTSGNPLPLPGGRVADVVLSSQILSNQGFGSLSIDNPDGDIVVPVGVTLGAATRGSIALTGANISIGGNITAVAGDLSFTTYNISPSHIANGTMLPLPDADRGRFTLESKAVLSTAGLIVDDRPNSPTALQTPRVTGGGNIRIQSYNAALESSSVINVSGGVAVDGKGAIAYGNAGTISIVAGSDSRFSSVTGGSFSLESSLMGYSGSKGGSLTLKAGKVQLGGADPADGTLFLAPEFFSDGGFSSFSISGGSPQNGAPGLVVKTGTVIAPVVSGWLFRDSGGELSLEKFVRPEGIRNPVSLNIEAAGLRDTLSGELLVRGDLVVEKDATINAGAKGVISLKGDTVSVQGSLIAHGGDIRITGAGKLPALTTPTTAASTVWIGSSATLDASGVTLLVPDAFGRRRGAVLDGGTISVSGNILAESGARMDVSGTASTLDLLAGESGKSLADLQAGTSGTTTQPYATSGKPFVVEINGGTIKLTGGEMLLTDATLVGRSGGIHASGGTLQLSSGRFYLPSQYSSPFDPTLVVVRSGNVIPSGLAGGIAANFQADTSGVAGGGRFSVDDFQAGGFANLDLTGTVRFSGPVTIQAAGRITAGTGPALFADSAVSLSASHIAAGTVFQTPLSPDAAANFKFLNSNQEAVVLPPTFGSGSLSASATLIDLGYLSLQGIGNADFIAADGDIRGNGVVEIAGNLNLTAGQIYPPSALEFTLAAFDYQSGGALQPGSVTIRGSGNRKLPLSAGGTLSVYASRIVQGGVLRAPLGEIRLGWNATTGPALDVLSGKAFAASSEVTLGNQSITSVSAVDPLTGKGITIPYGLSLDGTTWLDPRGVDITSGGAPQKAIGISAASVTTQAGSVVDISGGGDLYAYRWVKGQGGSTDVLASNGSFAILPGYDASYAPFAANNSTAVGGNAGYVNSALQVGQQIQLPGGKGLAAGTYTLLPARYALLPGAFLVTPLAESAIGSLAKADGAFIVSGTRFQGLETDTQVSPVTTRFELASGKVVRQRSDYADLLANTFLQATGGFRLPGDAGTLALEASRAIAFQGSVQSAGTKDFRGGAIDLSSPVDIFITGGGAVAPAGSLVLDSALLSGFGAESLLIGGIRKATEDGTEVTVTAGNVTVDNRGSILAGPEIILVAKDRLQIAAGAEIDGKGKAAAATGNLIIGNTGMAGSGNGALVRVGSSSGGVAVVRQGFTPSTSGELVVGADAVLRGSGIILDSTSRTNVDPGAVLDAASLSLSSGRVSLVLDPSVRPGADAGLVLSGEALSTLSSAGEFVLSSYTSLDLLGSGTVGERDGKGRPLVDLLTLRAAEIRGLQTGGGEVSFIAKTIRLDNQPGGTAATTALPASGRITFDAESVQLGSGALAIRGFETTTFKASQNLVTTDEGSLKVSGNLNIATPLVFTTRPMTYDVAAAGNLVMAPGASAAAATTQAGLGASLSFTGASVVANTRFVLASGSFSLRATGGDVTVGGQIAVGGVARKIGDATRYTDGGTIHLTSDIGNITLTAGSMLDVSSPDKGGKAGGIALSAANGEVVFEGVLNGSAGAGSATGSLSLDAARVSSFAALDDLLNSSGFAEARSYRIRNGNVLLDGHALAHSYQVFADQGSIDLTGTIDASGKTGGAVTLVANGDLQLAAGSMIDVSGRDFDSAGKGGSVALETRGGTLRLLQGSSIRLGVDTATATSAAAGKFTGTLNLRTPRVGTTLAIDPIGSTISGASSVIAEGVEIYDLSATAGLIDATVRSTVQSDAAAFIGDVASGEARENALLVNLGGSTGTLGSVFTVRPGVEIINPSGDLTLGGTNTSGASGDWNLAPFRFGAQNVPGVLTLRAANNLVFYNSLSDGFTTAAYNSGLMARNALLPDNAQGWSYSLTAGADFSSVNRLAAKTTGSLMLGKNGFTALVTGGNNALTSTPLSNTAGRGLFQVIRTGSGDIAISAGRDIQLLNQFATIYTAGTLTRDPNLGGTFQTPIPSISNNTQSGTLGAVQQPTPAPVQYALGGGNVSLSAGHDIIHLTQNSLGELIPDSERQMPVNWLYRRGYVDPVTGEFGVSKFEESASTTWWVDYTNFFEGIGALGGGNVSLIAGRDVTNVDAVAPTNGRMSAGVPNASTLVELGGGDVSIHAGRNIDGGVYYVERGHGVLSAGGSITTNATRSPSLTILSTPSTVLDPSLWLPTTLFLGKGNFDVRAADDLLLGPVVNAFLLPTGFNNTFFYKSYFSTYGADSAVNLTSLGGDVRLRQSVVYQPGSATSASTSVLQTWFNSELLLKTTSAAYVQPWLRLAESDVSSFSTGFSLLPGTLRVVSFSGDIGLQGNYNLSPSSRGTVEILATGSILGFNAAGIGSANGSNFTVWADTLINLSDASPSAVPGIVNPFAYQSISGISTNVSRVTQVGFLASLDKLFAETGSTNGVLQEKQTLHAPGLLHAGDTNPSLVYAGAGNIEGITLFSPKPSRIVAGQDIRDVSFYLQNNAAGDLSVVSAGRDLVAYDNATSSRIAANAAGNLVATGDGPQAGDIQIAGPGTLEVFAGRNLDLGTGGNNADGTGTGITSIGNGRNPSLPFEGADIIAGAGIGGATSLSTSTANFDAFIKEFVLTEKGGVLLKELGLTTEQFNGLDSESQRQTALQVFYQVLRDAGRDHNDPESPDYGNYADGKRAVATLFPEIEGKTAFQGEMLTRARDIRTRNGGDISLFAPGGGLALASTVIGNPLAPPGIITESGGNINVFTDGNVDLGISRIFTLRGGDEIIWSSHGDIAAGSSSKTVQSAPPTRVLIDPQSADVKTDLAGLATGGGIGVLATVKGVEPSDVDLVAPEGTIDAGDAGIRVSGNLNISAAIVINAGNISVGGASTGAAAPSVAAPSFGGVSTSANTATAATDAVTQAAAKQQEHAPAATEQVPSLISVEVVGYGGGDAAEEEDKEDDGTQQP